MSRRGRPSTAEARIALTYNFYAYPGDAANPLTVQCIRCQKPYTLRATEDPAAVAEWMRAHMNDHLVEDVRRFPLAGDLGK